MTPSGCLKNARNWVAIMLNKTYYAQEYKRINDRLIKITPNTISVGIQTNTKVVGISLFDDNTNWYRVS